MTHMRKSTASAAAEATASAKKRLVCVKRWLTNPTANASVAATSERRNGATVCLSDSEAPASAPRPGVEEDIACDRSVRVRGARKWRAGSTVVRVVVEVRPSEEN
jgi:hypothetical protein